VFVPHSIQACGPAHEHTRVAQLYATLAPGDARVRRRNGWCMQEAAAFLRPAVSVISSEAEPDPDAPRRTPAEVKARLHADPKARQMREARKVGGCAMMWC